MKKSSEAGSHIVGLALGIVVIAIIGFAGYRVWTMQQSAAGAPQTAATAATVPAKITNKTTLDQAEAVLDQSSARVSSSLDNASLNTYLKAML
jgi:hypothetical protein